MRPANILHIRHLTEKELKRIADYARNHTQTQTMAHFVVSNTTVVKAMRLFGIAKSPTGRPKKYTEKDYAKWRKFKGSLTEASRHFGVGRTTISDAIRKNKKQSG